MIIIYNHNMKKNGDNHYSIAVLYFIQLSAICKSKKCISGTFEGRPSKHMLHNNVYNCTCTWTMYNVHAYIHYEPTKINHFFRSFVAVVVVFLLRAFGLYEYIYYIKRNVFPSIILLITISINENIVKTFIMSCGLYSNRLFGCEFWIKSGDTVFILNRAMQEHFKKTFSCCENRVESVSAPHTTHIYTHLQCVSCMRIYSKIDNKKKKEKPYPKIANWFCIHSH